MLFSDNAEHRWMCPEAEHAGIHGVKWDIIEVAPNPVPVSSPVGCLPSAPRDTAERLGTVSPPISHPVEDSQRTPQTPEPQHATPASPFQLLCVHVPVCVLGLGWLRALT